MSPKCYIGADYRDRGVTTADLTVANRTTPAGPTGTRRPASEDGHVHRGDRGHPDRVHVRLHQRLPRHGQRDGDLDRHACPAPARRRDPGRGVLNLHAAPPPWVIAVCGLAIAAAKAT